MTARRPIRFAILALTFTAILGAATPARTFSADQGLPTLADAPVNDLAHVIDASSAAEIDRRARALKQASGDVVMVVTVDTVGSYGSIEEYSVRLFERAKIGSREKDNGVLILLAVKDRKVRIYPGYGLEEFITDGFAGETIRQAMLPAFRDGQYGRGLLDGTTRVIQRIAQRRGVSLTDVPPAEQPERGSQLPGWVIPVGVIIVILVLRAMSGSRRRPRFPPRGRGGTWSGWHGGVGGFGGGGFGGGFGGFGGLGGGGGGGGFGGFGGGRGGGAGATGGW
ncbi:MAG: TPM domain-containing protein [Acidobacteriota bacterium]